MRQVASNNASLISHRTRHSVVKVVVGTEEDAQTFFVHEELVVDRAHFFKSALSGQWLESDDKTVTLSLSLSLSDDDPEVFYTYLQLPYSGKLPIKTCNAAVADNDAIMSNDYIALVRLYILADKLQDAKSRNTVMDAILAHIEESGSLPGMPIVRIIFDGTSEGSPLRSLVVDLVADFGCHKLLRSKRGMPPSEFLLQLSRKLLRRSRAGSRGEYVDAYNPAIYYVEEPESVTSRPQESDAMEA